LQSRQSEIAGQPPGGVFRKQTWHVQRPAGVPEGLETVDQLVSLENGKWDEDLIRGIFDTETANAIVYTPINSFDPSGSDKIIWMLEKNGLSTASSAYRNMSKHETPLNSAFFMKLWTMNTTRIVHFICRSLKYALMTNCSRARVLPEVGSACLLCRMATKTPSHLFLHCSAAADVRRHGHIDYQIGTGDELHIVIDRGLN